MLPTLLIGTISLLFSILFYTTNLKMKMETTKLSTFECGFSSYFYSRFSFSIHYFMIGLIFLFLDLELCMLMPMMTEMEETMKMKYSLMSFISILLLTLLLEWKEKKLEWKY